MNPLRHPIVLVTHPERQHSHEMAATLHANGWLSAYVHGAPLPAATRAEIPAQLRQQVGYCRIGRRLMRGWVPDRTALEAYYRLIWSFDGLMGRRVAGDGATAVVAYENAALHQFRAAKKIGARRILDNSGVHHAVQDRMTAHIESAAFHRLIVDRKDEELALADIVLVCSTFAAESFADGGVRRDKIRIVTLGCDTTTFSSHVRPAPPMGPLRFLFVGRLNRLKGADILAEAAQRLRHEGTAHSLAVVASIAEAERQCLAAIQPVAELHDKVSYGDLPALHAKADCLVLPSRFDSFGFVVAEALASGLPVIVSDKVGAKDLIEPGVNGWIVPAGDTDRLEQQMRWCALNADIVRAVGPAARAAAERWNWARYRADLTSVLEPVLRSATPAHTAHAAGDRFAG